MKLSQLNSVADELKNYISSIDPELVPEIVFTNESTPISSLPESFIEIDGNGGLSQASSMRGIMEYNLALSLHVQQLPDGGRNSIRENFILGKFEDIFDSTLTIGKFHYSLDTKNSVYSGSDLIAGYTSKVLNINVKIY